MLYTSSHLEISIPIHTIIYPLICSLRCYIRLRRGYCVSCETPLYMSYRLMTIGWIRIKMTAPPMRHNEGTQSQDECMVKKEFLEHWLKCQESVLHPSFFPFIPEPLVVEWIGGVQASFTAIIIIALLEKLIRMSVKALAWETVALAQFVNFSRKNCSRPPI